MYFIIYSSRRESVEIASINRSQGYEYDFVHQPHDRYMCLICHLPSKDPQMTGECCRGQIMCKPCLDYAHKIRPSANICPVCRKEGLVTYPNFQLDREIRCLHVYCINKERGCEWQGEVNNVKDHLINSNGCQFQEVECTSSCGNMIERRNLATHTDTECPRRKVNCEYCHNITLEYQLMALLHINECPKFPIPCPNKCNVGTVPREDMEKHKGECQLEVIECSSKCGSKLERQKLSAHLKHACPRRNVSCQYCHNFGEYWFIDGKHIDKCSKFPLPCPNKCGSVPREDLKAHGKVCPLEEVKCEYHTVGCKIKLARKDEAKHMKEMVGAHLMMVAHKLSKIDDTQQELTDSKVKLTSDLNNSRDELAETKHELKDTKVELSNAKDELTNLQSSLDGARDKLDKTKRGLTSTKVELKTTKDELAIVQGSLVDTRGKLDSTKRELADTKCELTKTNQNTKAELKNTKDKLVQLLVDARSKIDETKQELSSNTTREFSNTNGEVAKLQNSLGDARDKLDKTTHELADTKVELENTKDRLATLQGSLHDARDKLDQTTHELADTKVELKNTKATLQGSLHDTREKLDKTKYELTDTKCELRKTKDEVAILKRSLSDAKDQLATTSKQISNLMVLLHAQMKPLNAVEVVSEAKPSVRLNAMGTVFKFGDRVCPVVIKMSEFKKKVKDHEQWYSDPFFTHTQGYKMRLSVVPAGFDDGKGTHLSVYLFLMRGPHDSTLKWPLKEMLEIKLLNQIGDSDHHLKTITFEAQDNGVSRGKGFTQFISNKDLGVTATKLQYLKDGCVFIQVTKL